MPRRIDIAQSRMLFIAEIGFIHVKTRAAQTFRSAQQLFTKIALVVLAIAPPAARPAIFHFHRRRRRDPFATPAAATGISIGQPRRVAARFHGNIYFISGNSVFKFAGGTLTLVAGNSRAGFRRRWRPRGQRPTQRAAGHRGRFIRQYLYRRHQQQPRPHRHHQRHHQHLRGHRVEWAAPGTLATAAPPIRPICTCPAASPSIPRAIFISPIPAITPSAKSPPTASSTPSRATACLSYCGRWLPGRQRRSAQPGRRGRR